MRGKKSIILLHGWTKDITRLKPLANELKKLGWVVHLAILPGLTSENPLKDWNLNDYAKYIESKYIKEENVFVFGHSFGGRITTKIASSYQSNLRGVILCATSGISRPNVLKRMILNSLAKTGKILILVPSLAKVFKKYLYKLAREHDYEKSDGIMKEVFKKIVSEDLKPLIGRIQLPVLILWGREDLMTPVKDAYFINKVLPKSKIVVFDNEGHKLPYNKPKELAKEINKWAKNLI